jgi:signal transduction histidine kinase
MNKTMNRFKIAFSRLILIGSIHRKFSLAEKIFVIRTNRIVLGLISFVILFTIVWAPLSRDALVLSVQIAWIFTIIFTQALKWIDLIYLSSNLLQISSVVAIVFHEKYFLASKGQEGGFYLFLFICFLLKVLSSEVEDLSLFKKIIPYLYPVFGFVFCFIDFDGLNNTNMVARQDIGGMFYVNLSFTMLMLAFFLTQQRILNTKLTRKIEKKQARIIDLVKKNRKNDMKVIINTEEKERKRFSKELHEGVAQLLATAKANVDLLTDENKMNCPEKIILNSKQLIKMAMQEVKNISHDLVPTILTDQGFYDAICDICERSHLKNGNKIIFCPDKNAEMGFKLDHEELLHVYRIVEESVSNIIRHSTATYAKIKINDVANVLILKITDNGCGFSTKSVQQGNGLKNIKNRAEVINANLSIESSVHHGTNIVLLINKKNN